MTERPQLSATRRELAAAERALASMRDSRTLEEVENAWREFLNATNRVWTKTKLECSQQPGFEAWWASRVRSRRSDRLLSYLHHARNSDEHTLTEIVTRQSGSFSIKPAPGFESGYIKSLEIRGDSHWLEVDYSGTPVEYEARQPRVKLERVYDRGLWYEPPTEHLGQPLPAFDPFTVASLGLAYCRWMIENAEARFCSASA